MDTQIGINAPWQKFYPEGVNKLEYPDCSLYSLVKETAEKYPQNCVYDFSGYRVKYKKFIRQIEECAGAFLSGGIKKGDVVTICLPNLPQAVIAFYALNKIGALPSMVHPLSAAGEIEYYLNVSQSVAAVTLDAFYPKFEAVRAKTPVKKIIVTGISDGLDKIKGTLFYLTTGRKVKPVVYSDNTISWKSFIESGAAYKGETDAKLCGSDVAAILYSGGTTGKIKGIELTNLNFIALSTQMKYFVGLQSGEKMLAIMPIFHGFGLGGCINTSILFGLECLLVPKFDIATYGKLLLKLKPNYIAGVPTLYETLLITPALENSDLSFLKGIFSGGDTLSIELKRKIDKFLQDRGCNRQVLEGYGLTECVTGSCLTPKEFAREGSIGVPLPDMYYKICEVGTQNELPYGEEGEICISGPTVMKRYINFVEENELVLQTHSDGAVWMHSGDLGKMDADGFIYFCQRLKRMIITSGYNVYPSQLENVLIGHNAVLSACIIGVEDSLKKQRVKAFIMLDPDKLALTGVEKIHSEIVKLCKNNIAKYAIPFEYEYRKELPTTLVGKTAYTVLENEQREGCKTKGYFVGDNNV